MSNIPGKPTLKLILGIVVLLIGGTIWLWPDPPPTKTSTPILKKNETITVPSMGGEKHTPQKLEIKSEPEEESTRLELVAEGIDFPSNIVSPKDGTRRIFVVEHHTGKIRIIKDGRLIEQEFLDIGDRLIEGRPGESGMFSIAFPDSFSSKKHFYVSYTNRENRLVLSRFKVTEETTKAIKSSEEIILATEPMLTPNHHCGHIAFGPKDSYLYICIGDGENRESSQNPGNLFGSILRLNVEGPERPYGIPPDNPFVDSPDKRPEIWAYGLRNPWMFSFNLVSGNLIIPDVGASSWEELNFQTASSGGGENYGWPLWEGPGCRKRCMDEVVVPPVFHYPHGKLGCAVIGGAVYQGEKSPAWQGAYFFADHCSGRVWGIRFLHRKPKIKLLDLQPLVSPTAIGVDYDGEIIVSNVEGKVQRLRLPENLGDGWKELSGFILNWQQKREKNISRELLLERAITFHDSPHLIHEVIEYYSKPGKMILMSALDEPTEKLSNEFKTIMRDHGSRIDVLKKRGSYVSILRDGDIAEELISNEKKVELTKRDWAI